MAYAELTLIKHHDLAIDDAREILAFAHDPCDAASLPGQFRPFAFLLRILFDEHCAAREPDIAQAGARELLHPAPAAKELLESDEYAPRRQFISRSIISRGLSRAVAFAYRHE